MKNIKEIEKIFYAFECLNKEYADSPEMIEKHREIRELLSKKEMLKAEYMEISDLISEATYHAEKQGFIYGFQYAVRLLIGE